MKIFAILIVSFIIFFPNYSYSISDKLYNQYMKRADFKSADDEMTKNWKHLKSLLNEDDFKFVLNNQRKWVKNGREKEVEYIKNTQPFYDTCRMYAISSYARAIFLGEIAKFLQNNPNYTQSDISKFISNLDYLQLLNSVAQKFEPNFNNTNDQSDIYLYCTYNYDTGIGDFLDIASQILGFFSGMKAEVAGVAAEVFSDTGQHKIQCKFNNNVAKYSVAYFYTNNSTHKRFREKETRNLSQKDYINGVKFSTTTSSSNLDFITIRTDANVNGEIVKTLYAYEVDPEHNKLIPIDTDVFLSDIVNNYEMK